MKNKCNNLLKQSTKKNLKDIGNKEAATSKTVWNTITLLLIKVFKEMKT